MRLQFLVAVVLISAGGLVWAGDKKPRQPVRAVVTPPMAASGNTTISGFTVSPPTVSFSATDPDLGSAGGSTATVTWTISNGKKQNTWSLYARATGPSFTGCATVPLSAVTVTCATATASAGTAACAAPFTLSTVQQTVASGTEPQNVNGTFTVTIDFSLADSWTYIAALAPPCTLTLDYTVDAP